MNNSYDARPPEDIQRGPAPDPTDRRFSEIKRWVEELLDQRPIDLKSASEDASFRRYFRAMGGDRSYIVMDAPPGRETLAPFVRAARRFLAIGLNVPEILDADHGRGFLLLSDLGSDTYLQHLNTATADRLYGDALGALLVLQVGTHTDPHGFPAYSASLLHQEMELFRDWYLARHLQQTLSPGQNEVLDRTFASLISHARAQPQVWVHRDYHSRNLMVTPSNNPGVLDFQDAVVGPVTYDLVSLLKDCYIAWPPEQVEEWTMGYFQLARQSGLPIDVDEARFQEWFDRMGVQRHLKVLGIFARLYHRDGKVNYLQDLPQVHHYLVETCGRYQDLHPLRRLLERFPPPGL